MFNSKLFRLLCLKSKKLQEQIAKELGISVTTFYSCVQGNIRPNIMTLRKISDYFGREIRDFINTKDVEEKTEKEIGEFFAKCRKRKQFQAEKCQKIVDRRGNGKEIFFSSDYAGK